MSTLKPRITITLPPRDHEVLRRLSAAGGQSMSRIVTDFLEVALPQMERMVVVMENAKALPAQTKESIKASLERAEALLVPALSAALEQPDLFVKEAFSELLAASRRDAKRHGAATAKALSTPVPVTRGSGMPKGSKSRGNARVVPDVPYSALSPSGKRVVLAGGEYFDRKGVLRSRVKNRGSV